MEQVLTNSLDTTTESVDNLEKSVFAIKLGDANYDDSIKLAEDYKLLGNKLLSENKYADAVEKFTDAINLNIETKKNSIYYSNRAFCHIKLENTGLAVQDATRAIENDKDYLKGYYRRASANLILNHLDEAIKDLELLYVHMPQDIEDKLKQAKAQRKKKRFLEAMVSDQGYEEV